MSEAILHERIERLDGLYKTLSAPVAVTSTLSVATIAYLASVPNSPLQAGDPIELYSFTLFCIVVSIVSYTAGHIKRPLFFRYLAILSLLTALVVPLTCGLVWLKLEDPWIIVIPIQFFVAWWLERRSARRRGRAFSQPDG